MKTYKWWNSELPLMSVVIYYQLLSANPTPPLSKVLLTMALFLIATIGIAGCGYLLNDIYDVEQDRRSGAENVVLHLSRAQLALRFALVLLMAWLPWLWLPTTPAILGMLMLEYGLFFAYSMPPIRLKNRGMLGIIADSLYAYPIPMSVSLLLFGRLGQVPISPLFWLLMIAWSFLLGLRSILTHQLEDAAQDQKARVMTFVTRYGWQHTFVLMVRRLLPIEATVFLLFLLVIGLRAPLVGIGAVVYIAWMVYRWQMFGIRQTGNPARMPELDRLFFCNQIVMSQFNTRWLPLLVLTVLVCHAPVYALVMLIHLVLFENGIKTLVSSELPTMRRERRLI